MAKFKVLVAFPYAHDGFTVVDLAVGDIVEIHPDVIEGLTEAAYIAPAKEASDPVVAVVPPQPAPVAPAVVAQPPKPPSPPKAAPPKAAPTKAAPRKAAAAKAA